MNRTSRMVVWHAGLALLVFGALALANSPGARAADVAGEIATAAQHAGYAANATAIGMAHAHLQHTINCLVGPNASGYDANALNPCKDMGSGAIPDTQDASKATALKSAVVLAQQGLKSDDLDAAKKSGEQAATEIKKAQ